jgi:hypothetical protein
MFSPKSMSNLGRLTVYNILIHTGKWGGGGVKLERRGEGQVGQQFIKLGQKYQHD